MENNTVKAAQVINGELTDKEINVREPETISPVVTPLTLSLGAKRVLMIETEPWVSGNPMLVWETSDPKVIYINPTSMVEGVIEAIAEGTATVTATNPENNDQVCVWEITVGAPKDDETTEEVKEVTEITLTNKTKTMRVGDASCNLLGKVLPEDAADKTLTWTSSEEGVVTVDQEGNITPVAEGSSNVTATAKNGVSASCKVTVNAAAGE